jgi:KaiC/GvpD/RAD55 family RecA-like ATPase
LKAKADLDIKTPEVEEAEKTVNSSVTAKQLFESLVGDKVRFVLIKGEPGAGKTTIAAELIKNYGNALYVSTRVSEKLTMTQQPVLSELLRKGRVSELDLGNSHKVEFEDDRLGSPEDIIISILEATKTLPKDPLIILDSWDGIAKRMNPIERQKIEQSLLVMAEANNARVLFVSEEPSLTTTDYVVDAVIALTDEVLEGRRLRRIAWKKLRGSPIPQRSYLYSLHEGRFNIFDNTKTLVPGSFEAKPFPPIKHSKKFFSTGSKDLDRFFGGGVERGSFVLIELGRFVNPGWHVPMIQSIESNFLANGGSIFIIPTSHSTPANAKAKLAKSFSPEILNKKVRVGYFQSYATDPSFVKLDLSSLDNSTDKTGALVRNAKVDSQTECGYFIGLDTLESFVSKEALSPFASSFSQRMKISGDALFAVAKHGSPIASQIASNCDHHLKLEEVDRTLVLYSLNPASELYHVEYDYSPGYPEVHLTPIL